MLAAVSSRPCNTPFPLSVSLICFGLTVSASASPVLVLEWMMTVELQSGIINLHWLSSLIIMWVWFPLPPKHSICHVNILIAGGAGLGKTTYIRYDWKCLASSWMRFGSSYSIWLIQMIHSCLIQHNWPDALVLYLCYINWELFLSGCNFKSQPMAAPCCSI